jgi:crotonobetainyl-CoA:carnitine CoA-transferase CaiB-like acyl-CoA transferase
LQRPDLIPVALQPPGPAHEPVRVFLRETFAQRSLADWCEFLALLDLAWAPVRNLHEAIHSRHAAARQMLVQQPGEPPQLGLPIKFSAEPGLLDGRLDERGGSTDAVLAEAGYSPEAIAALREHAAVG